MAGQLNVAVQALFSAADNGFYLLGLRVQYDADGRGQVFTAETFICTRQKFCFDQVFNCSGTILLWLNLNKVRQHAPIEHA